MTLAITSISNKTTTGFRINYDQSSPPLGFEDRVYIADYSIPNEIAANIGLKLIASITSAVSYVDVTGCSSGRSYMIRIFRYVNSAFDSSTREYGDYATTYAEQMTVKDLPAYLSFDGAWSEFWYEKSNGTALKHEKIFDADSNTYCLRVSDPSHTLVEYNGDICDGSGATLYNGSDAGLCYDDGGVMIASYVDHATVIMPKVLVPEFGGVLTFEQKIRYSGDSTSQVDPFYAFSIYNGEQQYAGVYFINGYSTILARSVVSQINVENLNFLINHTYTFKIVYTPGEAISDHCTVQIYIDNTLNNTLVIEPPQGPISMWIGGRPGTESITFWPMTISCSTDSTSVAGFCDAWPISSLWDKTGVFTLLQGSESQDRYGGITAQNNDGYREMSVDSANNSGYRTHWTTGNYSVTLPLLVAPSGKKFSTIKLRGTQANGYIQAQIKDANENLLLDSDVPGNSTGLRPNGTVLSVDLSGITTPNILIYISGNYDGTTVATLPAIMNSIQIGLMDSSSPSYRGVSNMNQGHHISNMNQGHNISGF